jgi:hypothetical protein
MPSRKSILSSQGFECNNWSNNWSFVNHKRKQVCFTGWIDLIDQQDGYLVLSDKWQIGKSGRRLAGYSVSLEYINDYVRKKSYEVCVLRHEAIDPNDERRRIQTIYPDLIYGKLEQKGSNYFVKPFL